MLTPRFSLSQDDATLTITIYAPFTNLENTEIFMDGTDFRFFSKPYYLRLHLPGEVEETDDAGGVYQADISSFVIRCPKRQQGEHFPGLDMITQLLIPKGDTELKNQIEEVGGEEEDEETEEFNDIDWYFQQTPNQGETVIHVTESTAQYGYGFNCSKTGVFKNLLEEYEIMLDVKNPDSKTQSERSEEREARETDHFSSDHYLCDLYESDEIDHIVSYTTEWETVLRSGCKPDPQHPALAFSAEEQGSLLALPHRSHKLAESERVPVFLTLLDILFAERYDLRINEGEPGPESGWCIAKLSPSLSSCTKHASLKQTIYSSIRRCLIYPLYRNWDLAITVWRDVRDILRIGKAAVVKSLLRVLKSFGETEGYYIFSQLYIQDYAVWIQRVPDSHLESLCTALNKLIPGLEKAEARLELDELEHAAQLTLQEDEEEGVDTLVTGMQENLVLQRDSDDDSSSDEDAASSSEDDTESDTDSGSSVQNN